MTLPNNVVAGQQGHVTDHNTIKDLIDELSSAALNVKAFGAEGDGVTDDTAAIAAALTALGAGGGTVLVPPGNYRVDNLTIPAKARLVGAGKDATTLTKNGSAATLLNMAQGSYLANLTLTGNALAGDGIRILGTAGQQTVRDVTITDTDGPCLYFDHTAGSQFRASGLTTSRRNSGTGTGRYAIVISDTALMTAAPRHFHELNTNGLCAIHFGGCNNVEVTNSVVADLSFTDNSRGVNIVATRWLNQASCTIRGHGVTVVACDVLPVLTIGSGTDNVVIHSALNSGPPIDSSGNDRNMVTHGGNAYTPVLTSGGTAPTLGNGTLIGRWSRSGAQVTVTVQLVIGSTTNLGTGDLRISLPVPRVNGEVVVPGNALIAAGATTHLAHAQIPANVGYLRMFVAGGIVTSTVPAALAAGDTIRVTATYGL